MFENNDLSNTILTDTPEQIEKDLENNLCY